MECKEIVAAIIERNEEVLIARRRKDSHLGGLWEFPGGKLRLGESCTQGLVRECREELGIEVEPLALLLTTNHAYPDRTIKIHFFRCRNLAGVPKPLSADQLRWVQRQELSQYVFPAANAEILAELMEGSGLSGEK